MTGTTIQHACSRLYLVGTAARFSEVNDFSGIASGTLGAQGPRKEAKGQYGVLWRVTIALHDVLFKGEGHILNDHQSEVQWPRNPEEVMTKVVEWWQRSNLPGVLGAVDGTLIGCPAPKKRQRLVEYGEFGNGLLESLRAWYCYKKKCVPSQTALNSSHRLATSLGTLLNRPPNDNALQIRMASAGLCRRQRTLHLGQERDPWQCGGRSFLQLVRPGQSPARLPAPDVPGECHDGRRRRVCQHSALHLG
jgi:hypothetical protein